MLAAFLGVRWLAWWHLPLAIVVLAVCLVAQTALLWVGAKYLAKLPSVGIARCALAVLSLIAISALLRLAISALPWAATPLGRLGAFSVGLIPALLLGWLMIKLILQTTYVKAILAWVPTLATLVLAVPLSAGAMLPSLSTAQELTKRTICLTNLNAIGKCCMLYLSSNDDRYPPSLEAMVNIERVSPKLLKCPSARTEGPSYFYLAPPWPSGCKVLASDFRWNHDGYRNVLLYNGRVQRMTAEAFAQEMADPNNARFAQALAAAEGSLARGDAPD